MSGYLTISACTQCMNARITRYPNVQIRAHNKMPSTIQSGAWSTRFENMEGDSEGPCTLPSRLPDFHSAQMHSKQNEAAVVVCFACYSTTPSVWLAVCKPQRKQRRGNKSAQHKRGALIHPTSSTEHTPWQRILLQGMDEDVLATTNSTNAIVMHVMVPLFDATRVENIKGNPSCLTTSRKGCKP